MSFCPRAEFSADDLAKLHGHELRVVSEYAKGKSAQQIAVDLGITVSGAFSAISRAKRKCGKEMRPYAGRGWNTATLAEAGEVTEIDLKRLTPRQRRAWDLMRQGLNRDKVAAAMQITTAAVSNVIQSARRRLGLEGSDAGGSEDDLAEVPVIGRCRCGLLLPCHSCLGYIAPRRGAMQEIQEIG